MRLGNAFSNDDHASSNSSSAAIAPGKRSRSERLSLTPRQGGDDAERAPARTDQAVEAEVQRRLAMGERNASRITDEVFWWLEPQLAGERLTAGSPEAREWLWLRDTFVAPAVHDAQAARGSPEAGAAHAASGASASSHAAAGASPSSHAAAGTSAAHAPASSSASPSAAAPASAPSAASAHAGGDHHHASSYRTQNDNVWMPGGTCNMTSLSMALIDLADGDEQRARIATAGALRRLNKPLGGLPIGGKREDLRTVLDTPELLARVQLEDLLTTLANLSGLQVTMAGSILEVAKLTGLAAGGKAGITGSLTDPKVRARAAASVAGGEQLILGVQGGPGHYVHLTAVRDDGVIVDDPAGARCEYEGKYFLPTVARSDFWIRTCMDRLGRPGWPEAARRRLSTNPTALAIVERLLAVREAPVAAQNATIKELATGAMMNMGASNFYSLADIQTYRMDIRVELKGAA